jgi:2'-5' RNA ligase
VGSAGKRLFIAVDIDESTRAQVGRISTELRDAIGTHAKASWVRPDRMHLTLQFCGSADAAVEERLRAALAQPIPQGAFDVSFDGVGFFPERGSPRVLWLAVRDGLEALRRLHTVLAEPTNDTFTPHLTLARFKDRVPKAKLAELTSISALAGPSRIDRVTLYESRMSPAGPTYVPLAEALLTRSG